MYLIKYKWFTNFSWRIYLILVVTLSNVSNLVNYETSFEISSNSTEGLSENSLLKMYEIENEIKLAMKNIPININYTIGHIQKANKLIDSES